MTEEFNLHLESLREHGYGLLLNVGERPIYYLCSFTLKGLIDKFKLRFKYDLVSHGHVEEADIANEPQWSSIMYEERYLFPKNTESILVNTDTKKSYMIAVRPVESSAELAFRTLEPGEWLGLGVENPNDTHCVTVTEDAFMDMIQDMEGSWRRYEEQVQEARLN